MRTLLAMTMIASALGACSSNASFTVNGRTLSVQDQMYNAKPNDRFPECQGLSTSQIKIQLADFAPVCPLDKAFLGPDPTIEHEALEILFSIDAVPDFKLNGLDVNPNVSCDIGGGPVYVAFTHLAVNGSTPDTTTVATGGHITVTQYDGSNKTPIQGKFTLQFGGSTINGSFNAPNCDM
jgi:hypothetical protein